MWTPGRGRKRGPKGKYSAVLLTALHDAIAAGARTPDACRLVGITQKTLIDWGHRERAGEFQYVGLGRVMDRATSARQEVVSNEQEHVWQRRERRASYFYDSDNRAVVVYTRTIRHGGRVTKQSTDTRYLARLPYQGSTTTTGPF